MANVRVEENRLVYGGKSFFRGGAGTKLVRLGSVGEKRTPLTKMNYLEVKDALAANKLGSAIVTKVSISDVQLKKSDFTGEVDVVIQGVPVGMEGGETFEKLMKSELVLTHMAVPMNQLEKAINSSPALRDDLDRWGNDARVVCECFFVVKAEVATHLARSGRVELSAGVEGLGGSVAGGGSGSGDTKVTYQFGSTFAYLLAKPEWGKGKDKGECVGLNTDQQGPS
jgi:hypothetical protein